MPSFPDKIKIVLPKLLFTPQHAFDDESLSIRVTKIYMNIKNKLPPPSITFPSHHSYTAPFVQAVFPVNSVDLFERPQCGFVWKSTMWICEEGSISDLRGRQNRGFARKAESRICEEGSGQISLVRIPLHSQPLNSQTTNVGKLFSRKTGRKRDTTL